MTFDLAAYRKAYYEANREKLSTYRRLYYVENKEQEKASMLVYRENNKKTIRASVRGYNLKKHYGLRQLDYEAMLVKQAGKCAICNTQFRNTRSEPAIDHNHTTGVVRDLLCMLCNTRLAVLESPMLPKYTAYLNRHNRGVKNVL